MKPEALALSDLAIDEADAFRRAGIDLLDAALPLLKNHRFIVTPGKGLARLADLLNWRAGALCEHIDRRGVSADQVIHFAIHHVLDQNLEENHPGAVLLAECLASASDLYLLGKLSQAGEETAFLSDTIESMCSYYEMYAAEPDHLEQFFAAFLENPFETMVETACFLFHFGAAFLKSEPDLAVLTRFSENARYPLVHHYNLTNWILTIRARFPDHKTENLDYSPERMKFLADESSFLELFRA